MKSIVKGEKKVNTNDAVGAPDFSLEQLFGSKTRVRFFRLLLDNPERSFYVRELTRRIEAQLNSVRRELKNLVDIGIILEVEGKILENEDDDENDESEEDTKVKGKTNTKKKYYRAYAVFSFFEELRSIMKKSSVLMNKSFVIEVEKKGKIDFLFLTGRFIDNKTVPSDLLIVGEIKIDDLQQAISNFEVEIGHEVNYTYMPKEEFIYRQEIKDRFLSSLLQTEKVVLINKLIETV